MGCIKISVVYSENFGPASFGTKIQSCAHSSDPHPPAAGDIIRGPSNLNVWSSTRSAEHPRLCVLYQHTPAALLEGLLRV